MNFKINVKFNVKCGTVYKKLYVVYNERGSVENVLENIFDLYKFIDSKTFHIVNEDLSVDTYKPKIKFSY